MAIAAPHHQMPKVTGKKLVNPGEKIRVICETCHGMTTATFNYGTSRLENDTPVDGIMLAECDRCGEQIAMARQSSPLVRATIESRDERRQAEKKARSTVRIPRVLADYACWALAEVQAPDAERFDLLINAFVMALEGAGERRHAGLISTLQNVSSPVLEQPCDYSVSIYFPDQLWQYPERLQQEVGLRNTSERPTFLEELLDGVRRQGGFRDGPFQIVVASHCSAS